MHEIQHHLTAFLKKFPVNGQYLVAFSGGCDSMVLLHAMSLIVPKRVLAVHINHGLQTDAQAWSNFCEAEANKLFLAFRSIAVNLVTGNTNIEAKAREARYRAFANIMSKDDMLITAHHEDDQAETLLLQLMRGSGVEGLGGMPECSVFIVGQLARPFLKFSKNQLEDYARAHNLQWIEDPTNSDISLDRNFLRNSVIPLLETRWSAAKKTIARSATNCQEASQLVISQVSSELDYCQGSLKHSLSISRLSELSPASRHFVIRSWVKSLGYGLPDRDKTEYICRDFIHHRIDAQPVLKWSNVELHRFNGYLYLLPSTLLDIGPLQTIGKKHIDAGFIELGPIAGRLYFQLDNLPADTRLLSVRYRQGGEKIRINQRAGSRKLKKMFQEWQVPIWMRNFVPLVFIDEQCIAVADYARCGDDNVRVFASLKWMPDAAWDWRGNLLPDKAGLVE